MKYLAALLLVATSLSAASCGCEDCKCTKENHCGCMEEPREGEEQTNETEEQGN